MKSLKILLISCLIITSLNTIKSQSLIVGGTGNLGLSKVTSKFSTTSHSNHTRFTFSGNFGMYLEKNISHKSSLGFEFLWVQIEGKEITKDAALIGEGVATVIGVISEDFRLHISYLAAPLYYRFSSGKLGVKVGIQPMLFLFASSNYKASGEENNEPFEFQLKTKDRTFDGIEIGPKLGIDYQLNNIFRLRADFFYGLTDITADASREERKNRQVTLGIQYTFDNKSLD